MGTWAKHLSSLIRPTVRLASDWVDLQWSFIVADLKSVASLSNGRLLDVGCGDKPYQSFFRPYITEYIGVEHAATYSETSASGHRGPDVLYDGRWLPFADGWFDTVLSVQVIEHTPQPQALIDEMARMLRPGGTLILTAPFSFRLHEEPHDYFRYSPHGLRAMVGRTGLEVLMVRAHGGLFSVLAHKLNTFLAFRAGRLEGLSQSMGKLAYEKRAAKAPRYWAMPGILPAMILTSAGARLLDRAFPEPTEALSFLMLARKPVCEPHDVEATRWSTAR